MKVNPATACLPGVSLATTLKTFKNTITNWPEKVPGKMVFEHCQICPQTPDTWNLKELSSAIINYPDTQFRFHANVRKESLTTVIDASVSRQSKIFSSYVEWFKNVNKIVGAKSYSWHAGRVGTSLSEAFDNTKALSDSLGIPVAIEGLYPAKHEKWLLSSWEDYAILLSSKSHYAIDLSHLHIVATQSGRYEKSLTEELLSSDCCIEIHLSDNDGTHDRHRPLREVKWWDVCLDKINPAAVVFTESDIR